MIDELRFRELDTFDGLRCGFEPTGTDYLIANHASTKFPMTGLPDMHDWLQSERGLSESTVAHYTWYARDLLRWGKPRGWELCNISPTHIDQYLGERSLTGWSRVSTADAASALRIFFRHAYREGWCQNSIADAIEGPRIYRQEGLPSFQKRLEISTLPR